MAVLELSWRPTGWFQIGWSAEIPVGGVQPMRYFGQDLVAFRTADGELHVLDAYCRHLGANLAHGGCVEADRIVCPFHGWAWNGAGDNVDIPYAERPNRAAHLRSWIVQERHEVIYLWHDVLDRPPLWELTDLFADFPDPEFSTPDDYYCSYPEGAKKYARLRFHPQVVLENSVDVMHFRTVHDAPEYPVLVNAVHDEASWTSTVGFVSPRTKQVAVELTIHQLGVGLSFTHTPGAKGNRLMLGTTPVEEGMSDMFQTCWLPRRAGDRSEQVPADLAERLEQTMAQLPNDIVIWENQIFLDTPALTAEETRGFMDIRRWASTFYAADVGAGRADDPQRESVS
jgi:nitrite reductase/ring-hydroxylating ferredoxin subunit